MLRETIVVFMYGFTPPLIPGGSGLFTYFFCFYTAKKAVQGKKQRYRKKARHVAIT